MSVINQMLKDLESRRAGVGAQGTGILDDIRWTGSDTGKTRRRSIRWVAATAVLAVVIALAWGRLDVPGSADRVAASSAPAAPAAVPSERQVRNRGETITDSVREPYRTSKTAQASPVEPARFREPVSMQSVTAPAKDSTPVINAEPRTAPQHAAPAPTPPLVGMAGTNPNVRSAAPVPAHIPSPSAAVPRQAVLMTKNPRPLSKAEQAERVFRDGLASLRGGDTRRGEVLLRKALTMNRLHGKAREVLAGVLIQAGRSAEARDLLADATRLHPRDGRFAMLYARLLMQQGDNAGAARVLERTLPDVTADPEYYAMLAAAYQRSGRHADAVGIYRNMLNIHPHKGVWWMGLAISLEAASRYADALQAYRRARTTESLNPDLLGFVDRRLAALREQQK